MPFDDGVDKSHQKWELKPIMKSISLETSDDISLHKYKDKTCILLKEFEYVHCKCEEEVQC